MTNYTNLSDFEINHLVARYHNDSIRLTCPFDKSESKYVSVLISDEWVKYDPCNNWSDAGPIIAASKINIKFDRYADGITTAMGMIPGQKHEHENPLRAAMIVFLMIREGGAQ